MQRSIQNPSVSKLPRQLSEAASEVASVLQSAGQRGWLVGGCVRDLALGRTPKDADMATGALPDQIEALFQRTIGVGKAFGTVIVVTRHAQIELTTFRSEDSYTDGRRPDQVRYGASLEEDAERRDFTCNALYLDPLSDELRDPMEGLDHLRQGLLKCVGQPEQRFEEDGLRLLRLARFAAGLELEVEPGTQAAARKHRERIDAVSGERKLGELTRIAGLLHCQRAIELLHSVGVLERVLPVQDQDLRALQRLPESPGSVLLLGCLLGSLALDDRPKALLALASLRPSRALQRELEAAWELLQFLTLGLREELHVEGPRSTRVKRYRHPGWSAGSQLWQACFGPAEPEQAQLLERWQTERESLGPAGLQPDLLLQSSDLLKCGIPKGARWGSLLREAEQLQLDGQLKDRSAALAWLASQA